MTKEEAIRHIQSAHDTLKEHPYRYNFSPEYEKSYVKCLFSLSDAWNDLIYRSDVSGDEKSLLLKFGAWIHNYNASLLCYHIKRFLIPYYEAVISVTHRYLDFGDLSNFYELDYRWYKGLRTQKSTRYYLVTKEMCGIDSSELPRYFPYGERLSEDEESVRNYIKSHWFLSDKQDELERMMKVWADNLLPVIQWHNKTIPEEYVPEHDGMPIWRSV